MFNRTEGPRTRTVASWVILALLLFAHPSYARPELVVAVHPNNTLQEVSMRRLRLLYSGFQRTWSNTRPIRLLLPKPRTDSMEFLVSRVFKKRSEDDVRRYYRHAVFRERIAAVPPQLSARKAIAAVESDERAIAIVLRTDIPESANVRVIKIMGQ